ncbi:hypothetical protein ACVW00_002749 [Marmoricola sp. URHA0025 HA25]
MIATVATAMYSRSLQRTREVVQTTVTQWGRSAAIAPVADPNAPEPPADGKRRPRLGLAVAAVAVMALTFGALTGVESILGQPIATLLGGSHASGTTLGSVGGTGSSEPARHRTRTTPTPTPTPSSTPTAPPSAEPSATTPDTTLPAPAPSTDPSASPTAPAPTPEPTPPAG